MPPFLAVLDVDAQAGAALDTGYKWKQYFATGAAATTMAEHDEVRQVLLDRMLPEAEIQKGTYDNNDPHVTCLNEWLGAQGDREQQKARVQELQKWWKEAKKLRGFATLLIKTEEFKVQRTEFLQSKNLCTS